jgi:uncharacterized repeat protein (TIGR03806 family)
MALGALMVLIISLFVVQAAPAGGRTQLPKHLSQTGIFRNLATLEPAAGIVPYDVNVPSWSDGAQTRRWLILPGNGSNADPTKDRIIVKPGLPWTFPEGSIFVAHFDWPADRAAAAARRLETRILVRDKDGGVYGVTYRWNADGTDARLIEQEETETLTVRRADGTVAQQPYNYSSPDQCVMCHNEAAGGVLGLNYRQLNRRVQYADGQAPINQVVAWNRASMLSKSLDAPKALDRWNLTWIPPGLPIPFWSIARTGQLTPLRDGASSIEARARAYLDANCSSCHAPGIANADWDARSSTPLEQQHLIGAHPRVPRASATAIIEPGIPEQSLLYLRMSTLDPALKMPPLGRNAIDEDGARLLAGWIRSLPKQTAHR